MGIDRILQTLNAVCDFADQHYPAYDENPKRLREMGEELRTSINDRQRHVMLTHIKNFLGGGMGSFADYTLIVPTDSRLSYAEFSAGYHKSVSNLYDQVQQALDDLDSRIDRILQTLNAVCDFADQYYPADDENPKRLREMGEELRTSINDYQRHVMLTQIKDFLGGGMGSFNDFILILPADSKMTDGEFRLSYRRMINSLYDQVQQFLE